MKLDSILFSKIIVLLFGVVVFTLCAFLVHSLLTQDVGGYYPILIGMLVAAIPFFIGIYQAFKLLIYINQKKAFSEFSTKSLKIIEHCGIAIGALYGISMPYIFIVADRDDAPGVILLGLTFTFAPLVIAVFAAIFQKIVQNIIDLKSENDLTV